MSSKVEKKTEQTAEQKCFWELVEVDSEGNFIVKVYNEAKQKELNSLVGQAKRKYTMDEKKVRQQDDRYAELVDVLGFEATSEMFSTAGKAYVYNVKREMQKDAKAEQAKQALLEGAASARQSRTDTKERAPRAEKQALVITEVGAW